jgi:hypothetical protein
LFPKSLRYMCSTPQKQPAAIVYFCAPSGTSILAVCSGAKRRVEDVKGLVNFWKIEVIAAALSNVSNR